MPFSAVSGFTKLTRLLTSVRSLHSGYASLGFLNSTPNAQTIARSFFFLSQSRDSTPKTVCRSAVDVSWPKMCRCGIHTKGDKEYVASLEEKISKEAQSQTTPILKVEDFDCKLEGSELTLSKSSHNEIITIKADLYNSLDHGSKTKEKTELEKTELKAKPEFTVEVVKNGKRLKFECRFSDMESEEEVANSFGGQFYLDTIEFYEDKMKDSPHKLYYKGYRFKNGVRVVAMKYLIKLGMTNDFVDELVSSFTSYEWKLNADLLQLMGKFEE